MEQNEDLTRIRTDPEAFERFYREHLEAVQGFLARRVGDPHLAADLTANVFLAAIDAAHRFRGDRGSVRGWIFGVARNVLADEQRQRARRLRTTRRIQGHRLLDEDSLSRIEQRIDAERSSRELYRAMDRLKPADRALLELVAIDGLSVAEAAQALGIKPGTARVRLHRSRALIKEHLRPELGIALTGEATS